MSKGLGRIQRRIIEELAALDHPDVFELTGAVFGVAPDDDNKVWVTPAQLGSVRRAIRQLEKIGMAMRQPWPRRGRERGLIMSTMNRAYFENALRGVEAGGE